MAAEWGLGDCCDGHASMIAGGGGPVEGTEPDRRQTATVEDGEGRGRSLPMGSTEAMEAMEAIRPWVSLGRKRGRARTGTGFE